MLSNNWKTFFEYICENNSYCPVVDLNSNNPNKIFIANIPDPKIVNDFFKNDQLLNLNDPVFIALIPNPSKIFATIFCCNVTLEQIHKKFHSFGLAVEGCFHVDKKSGYPNFQQSVNAEDEREILTIAGTELNIPTSYLVIENHIATKIVSKKVIDNQQPVGVTQQYIEGLLLYENGKSIFDSTFKQFDLMQKYRSVIGKTTGALIVAFDLNGQMFIISQSKLNAYNVQPLLSSFQCRDAILLCASESPHLIWKSSGFNTYNHTNFIGNPSDTVSGVLCLS